MTNNSFDSYQMHDNLIHGVSFVVENWRSDVRLDIDYIVRWPNCARDKGVEQDFVVSKGALVFCDVTDLKINIDWGESGYTTAISGVFIDRIERDEIATSLRLPAYYKWTIEMTDGRSMISFGASSMSLELIGEHVSTSRQFLLESERGDDGSK